MINGENLPNTFFVFSGFLLSALTYPLIKEQRRKSFEFFIKATVYRYVRLMPLMTFFLMFHASWLHHLDSGPFWDTMNFSERQFCRSNWWINILFLNNYFSGDFKCLVHSWYLSTDFHLSMVVLILLIVIAKRPILKYLMFSIALLTSFMVVVRHIFVLKLEPIFLIIPE